MTSLRQMDGEIQTELNGWSLWKEKDAVPTLITTLHDPAAEASWQPVDDDVLQRALIQVTVLQYHYLQ
ncbi:hypothetical protein INR49_026156 [Caranx melampygus]|nr:hypothetical protein INR49_026156 [Caranx melampygus]